MPGLNKLALHIAAGKADEAVVIRLLSEDADPNHLNPAEQPALFAALRCSPGEEADKIQARKNIFRLLWDKTDPNVRMQQDKDGHTVLHVMAAHPFADLMHEVLEQEPLLASIPTTGNKQYPIHVAILNGQLEMAECLFTLDENTADYNTLDNESALHFAARHGSEDMIKRCCEHHHGSIDALNFAQQTPLACALEHGNTETEAYLRMKGADESLVNNNILTQGHH
ncbi:MAG: ankyrin repeat domain-containing protein [Gammaproteobacteria bacterium]|nr:ankyrin repeat domain-containing protein [Gammaproteobacteria bacterium]